MVSRPQPEYSLSDVPDALAGCVLTIGDFDGVHVGHRRILQVARSLAASCGAPVAVLTMEPPPESLLRPGEPPHRLTPPDVRKALLLEAGADCVVTAAVDAAFLSMPPEAFVRDVIFARLAPRHVVEGPDFLFGRGRAGNLDCLREAGRRPPEGRGQPFEVRVVEPVILEVRGQAQRVSSTLIRGLVAQGDVESAAACLGRPFALYGPVVRGEGRGHGLDFPTANLAPAEQVLPGDGVYAGRADIEGRSFLAAVSVGTNPTFAQVGGASAGRPAARTVEAFLLDAGGDFYGRRMALQFLHRLRGQQRFASPDALRKQIAQDVERVRQLLR